jgi:hypothetical protein
MTGKLNCRAFLSHARHDATADNELVAMLTTPLQDRVTSLNVNTTFEIWRDDRSMHAGALVTPEIEAALRTSDILIVLLTPQWLMSNWCRKEYSIFESSRRDDSYIIPILVRPLDHLIERFTLDQRAAYARVMQHNIRKMLAADFLKKTAAERTLVIEELAVDITQAIGQIWRRRSSPPSLHKRSGVSNEPRVVEDRTPEHNFEKVDFMSPSEVLVDAAGAKAIRGVYAQFDFLERLYVQGDRGRVDFSVKRAFLSIEAKDAALAPSDEMRRTSRRHGAYYVKLHDNPGAISLCIDPVGGRSSLGELALPPSEQENYLSRVATVDEAAATDDLTAELAVSLDVEGLHVTDEQGNKISKGLQDKIRMIMRAALTKKEPVKDGFIRRPLPIKTRS